MKTPKRATAGQIKELVSLGLRAILAHKKEDDFGRKVVKFIFFNQDLGELFQVEICLINDWNSCYFSGLFFSLYCIKEQGELILIRQIQTPRSTTAISPDSIRHLSKVSSPFVKELIQSIKIFLKKDVKK